MCDFVPNHLTSRYLIRCTQIRSPQLRQAMGSVSSAMDSTNGAAIFSNFGLNAADGGDQLAYGDGVAALVHAVQARANRVHVATNSVSNSSGESSSTGGPGAGAATAAQSIPLHESSATALVSSSSHLASSAASDAKSDPHMDPPK
jgi:hypothetical protein